MSNGECIKLQTAKTENADTDSKDNISYGPVIGINIAVTIGVVLLILVVATFFIKKILLPRITDRSFKKPEKEHHYENNVTLESRDRYLGLMKKVPSLLQMLSG